MTSEHPATPAASAPPLWRMLLLLAVVLLVPALMMMTAAAIGAAAPDLKVAMQLTQPQVGLLTGIFFFAAGLALPFVGRAVKDCRTTAAGAPRC
jgi:hypothetical protein